MALCPVCSKLIPRGDICSFHLTGDNFSDNNRVVCNIVHRNNGLPRLFPSEREASSVEECGNVKRI